MGLSSEPLKKTKKEKELCFPDTGLQLSSLNQGLKVAAFHGKMWKPSSNRENEGSYQSWALWYGTKRYCEQDSPESRWWISLADANPWPSFRSRLAKEHESAAEFGEKALQAGQGMKANEKLCLHHHLLPSANPFSHMRFLGNTSSSPGLARSWHILPPIPFWVWETGDWGDANIFAIP